MPEATRIPEEISIPQEESEGPRSFSVMAKPVGPQCNLACSYCYYLKTDVSTRTDGQKRMTDTTLERYIRQYIKASPDQEISFVWHGGEPTLAGLDFFRQAVALQKRFLPKGRTCRNNLQTNGVLLDDEWCAFLAEADFDVGLSIDGAQWIHDLYRTDHGGRGSYAAASGAVRRMLLYGLRPDLLCTVTASSAREPLEVYRALRGLNTGWIQFIPIVRRTPEGELTPDSVSGEGYGDFLCTIFDEWVLHDLGKLDVQLFAETARAYTGGVSGLCWMAPVCGRVLIVEMDGGVYSCDHFVTARHRIGDIQDASLSELAESAVQADFGNAKRDTLPGRCHRCPHLSFCNGGCPKDRFGFTEDGEPGLNHLCAGLERFFSHALPVIEYIVTQIKLKQPRLTIMNDLREQMQAKWKGVGRNDPCPCGSGRKAKNCCWDKRL